MTTGIGEALRAAREAQDRTPQAVALSLKVRTDHVVALEDEDWEVFGADAYARGHLRNYARELGLDPAPLMAEYDLHVLRDDRTAHKIADGPVATKPREPLPQWVSVAGVALLLLVAIVVVGQVFGGRTPEAAPVPTDEPVASASASVAPAPAPTTAVSSPAAVADRVVLRLDVRADAWVRITVDGDVVQEGVLPAGTVRDVEGDTVRVRYGNAGGVEVTLNDAALGPPGPSGQIREVVYTPQGAEDVTTSDDPAPPNPTTTPSPTDDA